MFDWLSKQLQRFNFKKQLHRLTFKKKPVTKLILHNSGTGEEIGCTETVNWDGTITREGDPELCKYLNDNLGHVRFRDQEHPDKLLSAFLADHHGQRVDVQKRILH